MKCSLCGCEFEEKAGQIACRGCPMSGACHKIRCPNCGYEMPSETKLSHLFKSWRKNNGAKRAG